jgi:Predicted membrane protein (DUF2306)
LLEVVIRLSAAHEPLLWPDLGVLCVGQCVTSHMFPSHPGLPQRLVTLCAGLLVVKVTATVVSGYRDYFPPDFASDFLRGRESHCFGVYQWAFYTHILSGPVSLILGLILIAERSRGYFPKWHRYLGRVQAVCVLLVVTPSGLWMAFHAAAGPIAAAGLSTLAIATAACMLLGVRSAISGRFVDHGRWMWRGYLLLCSAVVLRLFGGLATVTGVTALWFNPLMNWMSWLAPLTAFELREWTRRR